MCQNKICTCAQTPALLHSKYIALENEINSAQYALRHTIRPITLWDELLLDKEFTTEQKEAFRRQMKVGRDRAITGDWYEQCKKKNNGKCELHHIIPLQYTHIFKKNITLDSNSKHHPNHIQNLALVGQADHDALHRIINKHLWPIYTKYGVPKNRKLINAITAIPTQQGKENFYKELKAALIKAKAETITYLNTNKVNAFVSAKQFPNKILKEILQIN